MKGRDTASFLMGAFLTGLAYATLLFLFLIATFSFSGEKLTTKENREAFCFYTVFIIIITTGRSIMQKIKRGNKYFAYGMIVPLSFAFAGFIILAFVYTRNLCYFRKFDKVEWCKTDEKPLNMAKTLVKHSLLIGMPSEKVLEMLAEPAGTYGDYSKGSLIYETDNSSWELRVLLEKGIVTDTYIYQEGLSL